VKHPALHLHGTHAAILPAGGGPGINGVLRLLEPALTGNSFVCDLQTRNFGVQKGKGMARRENATTELPAQRPSTFQALKAEPVPMTCP